MSPFILAGRIAARLSPLPQEYRIFYFFPFYHTGGAEKIHLQIAEVTGGADCIIYFTRKSEQDQYGAAFRATGCRVVDISAYTDNKWLYFVNLFYRGKISGYINRQQQKPEVFNGQCNFAYKISPWIAKGIRQTELIHSFNSFSYIRTPFLPFISQTIMISQQRIADHLEFYKKIQVPDQYAARIHYIPNAMRLPENPLPKSAGPLQVLFVGRGGPEKRVPLILNMARHAAQENWPVQFHMMGDVSAYASEQTDPHIHFYGNLSAADEIRKAYEQADVLILTSSTEGFPLVVIEAMAYGCAILATPVGDIPYHVKTGVNGFLFSSSTDESKIMEEGLTAIQHWAADREELRAIFQHNIAYARAHFDITRFAAAYNRLLTADKS